MAARRRAKRGTSLPPPCSKHGAQQHWLRPSSCATVREAAAKSRSPCAASARSCARRGAAMRGGAAGGQRPESRLLRQPALEGLTNSARTETPQHGGRNKSGEEAAGRGWPTAARGFGLEERRDTASRDPQPLWLRNHNFGLVQRTMVKRLATSPQDPLGINDSACKNQLFVVSVQYGPFNTYIPIRSTTIVASTSRSTSGQPIAAMKRKTRCGVNFNGATTRRRKETPVARSVVTKKRQQLSEQLLNNLLENIQPFNAINAQDGRINGLD
ncbi:thaumatin-like protein [Dorcoceras hygrometricum]|uniref:Thaumatin-like protein n=1 Tax=Dorcoceras hygrometricum TaxID=472368 RepID=A0A2Z7B9E2_9LAMI|nr:thaumatin-like protein [Dorcoceras hygrometricum]